MPLRRGALSASSEPLFARTCWCRVCQKLGAGSATVNVGFRSEDLHIEGALTQYVSTADSQRAPRSVDAVHMSAGS